MIQLLCKYRLMNVYLNILFQTMFQLGLYEVIILQIVSILMHGLINIHLDVKCTENKMYNLF